MLDLHFVQKEKAELQPRLPMALVIELCSPLTTLFNGFPGFITTGLSKFVKDGEASATRGKQWQLKLGDYPDSRDPPASHWNLGVLYSHVHVKNMKNCLVSATSLKVCGKVDGRWF